MKATIRAKKKVCPFRIVIIQTILSTIIFSLMYNNNFLIIAQIGYGRTDASNSLPSTRLMEVLRID
jgi:hypothetical protein